VLLVAGLGGIATYFLAKLAFHGGMLLFRERRRAAKVRREAEKINRQNPSASTPEGKE
jgi:ketopantoate reductase